MTAPKEDTRAQLERQQLLAGHLLRRIGFGPTRRELSHVRRIGIAAYLEEQLFPERIDDQLGEQRLRPAPGPQDDGSLWQARWLTRMAYSRRQLQEKMTLVWHELFATSKDKVGTWALLRDQEQLLRAHALGGFRQLLLAVSRDNAMLLYLDNSANDGQAVDGAGQRVAPNENYARELLQLFALGDYQLARDGTRLLGDDGQPLPAFSEADVKAVARALTGWTAQMLAPGSDDPTAQVGAATFDPARHDAGAKRLLGETIPADAQRGERDLERVVDILMRQPTLAPFIARQLLQKLATETPTPAYVARVATAFSDSDGDIRTTLRAIVLDAEFWSPEVLRSQPKTPLEFLVGAARGLGIRSGGNVLLYWSARLGQQVYFPPSVFSFYRPGDKVALLNAGYVVARDQAADMLAAGLVDVYIDAAWDAAAYVQRHRVGRRPGSAVDRLARDLLAAPLRPAVRAAIVDSIGPLVTEEKLRGAAWLILCSPDYQVN